MDPGNRGRCPVAEWGRACRELQFQGNILESFAFFDRDKDNFVKLEDVAPEAMKVYEAEERKRLDWEARQKAAASRPSVVAQPRDMAMRLQDGSAASTAPRKTVVMDDEPWLDEVDSVMGQSLMTDDWVRQQRNEEDELMSGGMPRVDEEDAMEKVRTADYAVLGEDEGEDNRLIACEVVKRISVCVAGDPGEEDAKMVAKAEAEAEAKTADAETEDVDDAPYEDDFDEEETKNEEGEALQAEAETGRGAAVAVTSAGDDATDGEGENRLLARRVSADLLRKVTTEEQPGGAQEAPLAEEEVHDPSYEEDDFEDEDDEEDAEKLKGNKNPDAGLANGHSEDENRVLARRVSGDLLKKVTAEEAEAAEKTDSAAAVQKAVAQAVVGGPERREPPTAVEEGRARQENNVEKAERGAVVEERNDPLQRVTAEEEAEAAGKTAAAAPKNVSQAGGAGEEKEVIVPKSPAPRTEDNVPDDRALARRVSLEACQRAILGTEGVSTEVSAVASGPPISSPKDSPPALTTMPDLDKDTGGAKGTDACQGYVRRLSAGLLQSIDQEAKDEFSQPVDNFVRRMSTKLQEDLC